MKYTKQEILSILDNVKEGAGGSFTAKCPAHDDNNNSFSIGEDSEGFAVCNCFAGCSQFAIWAAIYNKLGKPQSEAKQGGSRAKRAPVASYFYKNEAGEVIDIKNRFEPALSGSGKKSFTWSITTKKRREALPLYHLTDILNNDLIFAVEGEKDCDNLQALGFAATNTKDGFTAENMRFLAGKHILIIADNDNAGRRFARNAAEVCRAVAASVKIIDLAGFFPALPQKGDISDFIEMKGDINDLIKYADSLPVYIPDDNLIEDKAHAHAAIYEKIEHYSINKKGILTYTNGDNITPLCYGSMIIKEIITKINGVETEIYFKVEAITTEGRILPPAMIAAGEFDSLNWIRKEFGADIATAPQTTAKSKLVTGVVLTGKYAARKVIYTHSGYIMQENKPAAYIHAGGALGRDDLQSALIDNLSQYKLAGNSRTKQEATEAARKSMLLLSAHDSAVVFPLFAFVYLAPIMPIINNLLGETGFCLYLQGKTQSGKSTLAALALSHFGRFSSMTPPVNFNSTANYINEMAFYLKDSVLWVDDFHPQGTKREADKQAQIFQNIARAAGDHAQRGRLTSAAKIAAAHKPRCLFLATGEDLPQIGQSGAARLFTLQVNKDRKDIKALQIAAQSGELSRALCDYISFIISDFDAVKTRFEAIHAEAAKKAIIAFNECRLSNQSALLYSSALLYLQYATGRGFITAEDYKKLAANFEKYIFKAGANIEKEIAGMDPVSMYIKALKSLISSGRRYVIDLKSDDKYKMSENLGADDNFIGWKDSQYYYLDSNAAFKAAFDYYQKENTFFNITRQTLNRELLDNGLLVSDSKNNPTIVKNFGYRACRVLRFHYKTLEDLEGGGAYD